VRDKLNMHEKKRKNIKMKCWGVAGNNMGVHKENK